MTSCAHYFFCSSSLAIVAKEQLPDHEKGDDTQKVDSIPNRREHTTHKVRDHEPSSVKTQSDDDEREGDACTNSLEDIHDLFFL